MSATEVVASAPGAPAAAKPRLDAITVGLSAFLLFAIQPMAAKEVLPEFGGAASVWTACLLFFQAVLLAGYGWAHWVQRRPKLHLVVLALPVATALTPLDSSAFSATGGSDPLAVLLARLALSVGLPYFALSATSPLLQAWMADYRLYAFSNLGSLLGILVYIFVIDLFDFGRAALISGYLVFAALMATLCLRQAPRAETKAVAPAARPTLAQLALWTMLAACGTGLLASTTNQISQEVAPIPLLWVLPLSLYLGTFVLCFESPRWYSRVWYGRAAALLIPMACLITPMGTEAPFWLHLLIDLGALFVALTLCHGELAAMRPDTGSLTWFYLAVGGGGVAGTLLVALAAPAVFTAYLEFPVFLMLSALAVVALWWKGRLVGRSSLAPLAFAGLVPLAFFSEPPGTIVAEVRNFYGVARVTLGLDSRGSKLMLTHGRTLHGTEYVSEKAHPRPSTYYTASSGVGLALNEGAASSASRPRSIGVVGLGAGTLASYAKPGDKWRFYEINPDVIRLAKNPFTYLQTAPTVIDIAEGDARLILARELRQGKADSYDVLIVDAFSSDSVPVHLLTVECGAIYKRHLAADGVLAIHISNRTLDLEPVVRGLAEANQLAAIRISNSDDAGAGVSASSWILLSSNVERLHPFTAQSTAFENRPPIRWRDGHAQILSVLQFGSIAQIFRK